MQRINKVKDLTVSAIFCVFIITGAFIRFDIGVIPFTMQFFFVNLAMLTLNRKNAVMSVFMYVILGLIGLPVFAQGGGPGYILNHNFGFITGFIFGNFVSASTLNKIKTPSFINYILVSLLNIIIIYIAGIIYYLLISTVYTGNTVIIKTFLISFLAICLPGDIISLFLSSLIAGRLKIIVNKY